MRLCLWCALPLTRLAALDTFSRNAGEGGPGPQGWVGEGDTGISVDG